MPINPSTPFRRRVGAAVAAAALLVAAGCGSDDDDDVDSVDQVSYLTGFGASAHDTFIWVADELGYFEDAGLEVEIVLGGGTQNYHNLLAGQAEFTYIDYTGMLIDVGRGEFAADEFRALSAVHHSTLVAIMAPESSGITSPQDLEGATIGAFAGSPTELLLPAYAELSGWEFSDDQVVQTNPQEIFTLIPAGNVDVLSTFIIQQGVVEAQAGESMNIFPFNEVLDDLMGTGLITTAELADEDPELAVRFRDAALEALRYTLDHPEEAIEIMQERNPAAVENVEPLVAQIEMMRPYITSEGEENIGVIDENHLMRGIAVLESAGLIPPGTSPDDLIGEQTLTSS